MKKLLKAFWKNNNFILADERGFGKTVTLIAFLQKIYKEEQIMGPFLVVTSSRYIKNWK